MVNNSINKGNATEKVQTQNKSKLKGLFDEIDKKKKKNIKNYNNNKIPDRINFDPERNNTKPTKPDFSTQIIENGIIGLSLNTSQQYKGLINFGNICYSNVVMQCIIALKEFVSMLNIIFKKIEDLDNIEKEYPVLCNLVRIMNYYNSK
jgi:ubiquitin C-terminal hydrolase